ncbi:SLATT domain-containing protein [Segatella copri]|uniref:SLATT domain-containing protein n=1 Tax=Segatella copri TaxID=165179 RepID=UPI003F8C856D
MENLESLGNTIYKTMSARFTASRRMKRSRDASKVCEAMFSASIIAISLIALQKQEIKVANMISAFTIILSTFLLVLSLLFSSLNYDKRMENYHACGNELNRLYRLIKHDVNVLSKEELEKKEIDYINKYEEILSKYNLNQTSFDYQYAMLGSTEIHPLKWLWFQCRYYIFDVYLLYWIIAIAPTVGVVCYFLRYLV